MDPIESTNQIALLVDSADKNANVTVTISLLFDMNTISLRNLWFVYNKQYMY